MKTTTPISKGKLWTSWIFSVIVILFLLMDSTIHLIVPSFVVESLKQIDLPIDLSVTIGAVELVCVILYAIPRTSVFGAILQTGYLGGAVAILARHHESLFNHTLFPVYVGILLWGGIYLRDDRVRALIPFRK